MSDNEIPSSNQPAVLDTVEMGSSDAAMTQDHSGVVSEHGYFWVGIKIPKSLIFGGLGYVAGGFVGVYGGFYGLFLAAILAILFFFV